MFGEKRSQLEADEADSVSPEQPITEEALRAAAEVKHQQLQADIAESATPIEEIEK